ncbi:zinc fingers and homeoboxes protein 1 [Coregonus clupeaformis]|uniref:zinc fingers and homeoboxes protein 1 n=1 Tax=Coregonus clupeaformis TaxID=59861 RepID=UPI001BE0F9A1|nr:zinc fingers and homeoboxes protein 1 [Coregonus clupeaformis]
MASRRKSTTPCMVLPSSNVMEEQDADMQVVEVMDGAERAAAERPTDAAVVSTDPESEHDISQSSGEDGVTRTGVKRSNQPTLEQTVSDLLSDGGYTHHETEDSDDTTSAGISLSKTPIMKMRGKSEPKRMAVSLKAAEESDGMGEAEEEPLGLGSLTHVEMMSPHYTESMKHSVLLNIPNKMSSSSEQKKSSVLSSNLSGFQLPPGLAQVLSALQAQQSVQPQLLIPVSSIPSYNQSMDTNIVLVNTYKKFPYPSVSEIMGLSAQTIFSEEQIKIWFSAQRLKHGVSWTPEEVEEARRKQFNGTVHTVPQTITVIPAHQLSAAANGLQSILQTCQIVGQPGLVFTQVGTPVTTPITLTVAGMPSHSQVPKMSSHQTSPAVSEMKRATTVQPPSLTPQENSALSADHFGMRPKKSKEQLAELKASYLKNHFASDAEIARLMKLTGLTKGEIKKWFSDTRYNQRNSKNSNVIVFHDSHSPRGHSSGTTIVIDSSDETPQSPLPTPSVKEKETRPKTWNSFPDFTLQKFKEKTPEQLVVLEESYQKGSTPSDDELTRLRTETKLTRREIDAWFTEKRKVVEAESPDLKAERMESEATSSRKGSQTPPGGRRPNRGAKNIGKKTPEQLHVLKSAFVRTQWPSTEEYDKLAEESGLPRVYIVNWFGDTRYSFKNGNLKWFFHYQSGNVEGLNGNKNRKRRIRNRGWGRSRSRKAKKSPPPPPIIKFKSGKDVLKEYYLKHKLLNEQDLDELVAKSSMGYEQVREWFAEIHKREDMGADPFGDAEVNEDQLPGENEMAPEEQDDTVVEEEEEEDDDTDESDSWEPSQGARKTQSE